MIAVNCHELRQMYQGLGPVRACEQISEYLALGRSGKPGGLRASDFDLAQLAEAVCGREWVDNLDPRRKASVLESGELVDTSAFTNITGQIYYSAYLEGYEKPEFVFSRLTSVTPTRIRTGEKIAGVTDIKEDMTDVIKEGMPYPTTGYGEDYIETPALQKRGKIMNLTREHIVFRLSDRFIKDASALGELDGLRLEKILVDHYIGKINSYSRQGTGYNTYLTVGGWVNDQANPLTDYTSIDKSRLLLSSMKDPNTGESIVMRAGVMVVTPSRLFKAKSILNATEVRTGDGASNSIATTFSNPVAGLMTLYESQHMYDRLQSELSVSADNSKEYWLHFDPSKFITIMEGWPMELTMQGADSNASFERDVIQRYKVSSMRVPAILEPRAAVRNKNS